ncbi:MAG: hypothetical protein RLZZ09_2 [Pseudomonadota bacterium]
MIEESQRPTAEGDARDWLQYCCRKDRDRNDPPLPARGTVASRVQMHGILAGLESLHLQFYFHLLDALTGDPLLQLRRTFDQGIGATSQGGGGLDGFLRFGGDLKSHCRAKQ